MFDFPFYFYDTDGLQRPLTRSEERAILLVGVALGAAALLIAIALQSSG